jgi:protoporphyrinogen oxidase
MQRAPRVAVIGAGLAGVAVARQLAERGFSVAVLERAERPGGRCAGELYEGFDLEPASAVMSTADRRLLGWIVDVGLRDELLPLRPMVIATAHRDRVAPVDSRGLLGIARTPGIRVREALRLVRLPRLMKRYGDRLAFDAPERAASLDDRSVYDFGRLYFGESIVDGWMAPGTAGTFPTEPRQASRALFLRRHRDHARANRGLPRATLGAVVDEAARRLPLQLAAEVARIEPGAASPLRAVMADGRAFECEAVVVATDAVDAARIAAPILSTAECDGLARVRYAPALVLAAGLRRPFTPHPMEIFCSAREESPLATVLLEPGVSGGRVPHDRGLATLRATAAWSAANAAAPDEAVVKSLREAFGRLYPEFERALLFEKVLRVERAYPHFDVGRYRDIARFERVQGDLRRGGRRVYFAGDYLVDPSWEGALTSAAKAAAAVAQDFS